MAADGPTGQLEIHFLNAGTGEGESIVLRLPDGKYGVVDCFARSSNDPTTNPTLQFLLEKDVPELEFLCLTHPHDDHFRGMSHILSAFPVRWFWHPGAMSGEKLAWLLEYFSVDSELSDDGREKENASELRAIFDAVEEGRRRSKLDPIRVQTNQELYPIPPDTSAPCRIVGLAPSGSQVARYENALRGCFTDRGALKETLPHSRHNMISAALLITFGRTRVVLCGDVERPGWDDTIAQCGEGMLDVDAVKVAHHGSVNGYTDGLWEAFSASSRPFAVIFPFERHHLPKREGLTHIQEYTRAVFATYVAAIPGKRQRPVRPPPAPLASRLALRQRYYTRAAAEPREFGRCTLIFDDQGACDPDPDLRPPAGQISP